MTTASAAGGSSASPSAGSGALSRSSNGGVPSAGTSTSASAPAGANSSRQAKYEKYLESVEMWADAASTLVDQLCFEVDVEDESSHALLSLVAEDARRRRQQLAESSAQSGGQPVLSSSTSIASSYASELQLIGGGSKSLSSLLKQIQLAQEQRALSQSAASHSAAGRARLSINSSAGATGTRGNGNGNGSAAAAAAAVVGPTSPLAAAAASDSTSPAPSPSASPPAVRIGDESSHYPTRLVGWGRLPQVNGQVMTRPSLLDNRDETGSGRIQVKRLACSGHRGLYISFSDDIYSFGDAEDDELAGGDADDADGSSIFRRPRVVQEMVLERVLQGRRVVSVACGHQHSVAVTMRGELWSWGCGDHGRLGHGDSTNQKVPRVCVALLDRHVRAVACGGAHTVALATPSTVFAWGLGRHGRLGLGNTKNRYTPTIVDVDSTNTVKHAYHALLGSALPERAQAVQIERVACGWAFTVLVASNGTVRTFGSGEDGQCGIEPAEDQLVPTEVAGLRGIRITEVACGYHHTLALAHDGAVWSWGMGEQGQLGQGPDITLSTIPRKVRFANASTAPSASTHNLSPAPGSRVTWIVAGQFHSLGLLDSGKLMAWGSNRHSALGCGHTQDSAVPLQVAELPVEGCIEQIAAGQHFTLVLLSQRPGASLAAQGNSSPFVMFTSAGAVAPAASIASLDRSASQSIIEAVPQLRSGLVRMWKHKSSGWRKSSPAWRPRFAVLSDSRFELYKDASDSEPDVVVPLGPHLRIVVPFARQEDLDGEAPGGAGGIRGTRRPAAPPRVTALLERG